MRSMIRFITAVVALGIAVGLGWLFYKMKTEEMSAASASARSPSSAVSSSSSASQSSPSVTPVRSQAGHSAGTQASRSREPRVQCRVDYPDLGGHLKAEPIVVRSCVLEGDFAASMERQILLFKGVMGIGSSGDSAGRLGQRLEYLRNAFPEAGEAAELSYRSYRTSYGIRYYTSYPVERETNERMVNDFNHVVKNARIDELDYVIQSLEAKLEKWKKKTDKVTVNYRTSAAHKVQLYADEAFLEAMPEYIDAWKDLREKHESLGTAHLDASDATQQWGGFERNELPHLNAYIKENTEGTWPLRDGHLVDMEMVKGDSLYLFMVVAGRELYFPLEPAWDDELGMAIAQVGR